MPAIDPIYISVKDAAEALAVSTFQVYSLLNEQKIASRYEGSRRLVVVASLREYVESMPTTRPEPESVA